MDERPPGSTGHVTEIGTGTWTIDGRGDVAEERREAIREVCDKYVRGHVHHGW